MGKTESVWLLTIDTLGDAFPGTDMENLIQKIGQSNWISTFDVKGAYWQIEIKPEHQWLTAFVWDGGLYEFTRAPFGQKNSGNTFMRAVNPLCHFAANYVDDMSFFSKCWTGHLEHLDKFLQAIKKSGLTLNLKKCCFAQKEVRFVGLAADRRDGQTEIEMQHVQLTAVVLCSLNCSVMI